MIEALAVISVFVLISGIFLIRLFIGEKFFWGRKYLSQGYQILLSRRFDAYIMDTLAVCFTSPFLFIPLFFGKSVLCDMGKVTISLILVLLAVTFLCGRLLEKSCVFYNEQGLLISKPFRRLSSVQWSEIKDIQKRHTTAQLYNVLDQNGQRLAWFPLNLKTQPFLELAQKNGVSICISKEDKMVLHTSSKKLNGTLGSWDAVLAQSAYSQNDITAFVQFQNFSVVLFLDKRLNENNVIAINQDGTIRWKISDIIKQTGPIPYVALKRESEKTISVMAVISHQYNRIIYEIDVYEQKIVRQQPDFAC